MNKLLLVAVGGAIGAVLRYAVYGLAFRYFGATFPWGTFAVNLLGSFFIGVAGGLAERAPLPPAVAPFLLVGVLGAFTTFSTFAMDSFGLLREGATGRALFNLVGSNVLGLSAVCLGFMLARALASPSAG